jgi:hypothetical protein
MGAELNFRKSVRNSNFASVSTNGNLQGAARRSILFGKKQGVARNLQEVDYFSFFSMSSRALYQMSLSFLIKLLMPRRFSAAICGKFTDSHKSNKILKFFRRIFWVKKLIILVFDMD